MRDSRLFEPASIGGMGLKNRVVLSPMNARLPEGDGKTFNRGQEEFYAARAKGGAGLIITGHVKIEDTIDPFPVHTVYPVIDTDAKIKEMARIAERVHLYGTKIVAQLNLGGGRQADAPSPAHIPVGPSENPVFGHPHLTTRELGEGEIAVLVDCFGQAAGRLRRAGFDGVYYHTNGYLLDQFLTEKWNRRRDRYGGSLQRRMQLFRELQEAVDRYAGPDFPRIAGLVLDEGVPDGRTFAETVAIAKAMQESGVDAFHVRVGSYGNLELSLPSCHFPDGTAAEIAGRFKQEVCVPVIVDGKLATPELCEELIVTEKADLIGIARPFIADSAWANKVKSGDVSKIRPCLYCMQCSESLLQKKYLSCSVNPEIGWEGYPAPAQSPRTQTIAVIGGGPGGMEFAYTASRRGFAVHLFECRPALGGKLLEASVPDYKSRVAAFRDWLQRRLGASGVKIHLHEQHTVEAVRRLQPDIIVSAVGAVPLRLPIPGIERTKEALSVLRGEAGEMGRTVIVIGGGLIGCEAAYLLAKAGSAVTVVEMLDEPLKMESIFIKKTMLHTLEELGVTFFLRSRVTEIKSGGLVLETAAESRFICAETVVLAAGMCPDTAQNDALQRLAPEVYCIGDAKHVGKIFHAVLEGHRLACEL